MNGIELKKHMKAGKRFVVYGDPVYFTPGLSNINPGDVRDDPCDWYRYGVQCCRIGVNIETEGEHQQSRGLPLRLAIQQALKEMEEQGFIYVCGTDEEHSFVTILRDAIKENKQ